MTTCKACLIRQSLPDITLCTVCYHHFKNERANTDYYQEINEQHSEWAYIGLKAHKNAYQGLQHHIRKQGWKRFKY